ncbi:MAG TPA: tripartite tricarboxylate transporter substrate binding protein [Burkholderiales bacterium]|jgi:tripartite-type tricarboxylate transporter receptor subunit TctC|nr:tripartite tricarboxylate transporter substrate binding protein [Burkholderiales bacterium]
MSRSQKSLGAAVAVVWLALVTAVPAARAAQQAKDYPTRSVRMVVPFAPGGSNDIMARLLGQKLTETFGQQFIVDNRPGASGIIGTEIAAKATPDGQTLLVMSLTLAVNPSLHRKLPYDTEKDLAPITVIAAAPLMLVVHPSLPVKSTQEFIAYAKANPGKLNFGSGGPGSTPHLAGELLKTMAGIQMTHVPFKGGGPALSALVGGEIQLMLENIPSTLPYVQSGRLRALAVTSRKRSPMVTDLPTLDESGVKGYELVGWNGLFAPGGTPKAIITKLYDASVKALEQPDVKKRLAAMGAEAGGNSPEEFRKFIRAEIAKWAKVVKASGMKVLD